MRMYFFSGGLPFHNAKPIFTTVLDMVANIMAICAVKTARVEPPNLETEIVMASMSVKALMALER